MKRGESNDIPGHAASASATYTAIVSCPLLVMRQTPGAVQMGGRGRGDGFGSISPSLPPFTDGRTGRILLCVS